MPVEIIAAIISAIAVILAAFIGLISIKSKKKNFNGSNNDCSTTTINGNNNDSSRSYVNGDNNIVGNNNTVSYVLPSKDDSKIQIVDAEFLVDRDGYFIDIKIRNTGDKVAFIKKIVFNVYDTFAMKNPQVTQYSLIKSTATYDIVLNGDEQQVFSLSQSIAANNVDRFKIKIASSIAETRMVAVYHFSFDLYYDEDDKKVKSQPFVATFPSTREWAGCFVSHTSMDIAKSNYLELLRISKFDCAKSKNFLSILESYEKNKDDFM